jgi:ureidoacrylate peracid hydrolase
MQPARSFAAIFANRSGPGRDGVSHDVGGVRVLLTKDKTLLIVVDMQNGFCHAEGSFAKLGLDVTMTNGAIAGCARLVALARKAGVPIVFTRYVYRPDYLDGGILVQELMPVIAEVGSLTAGSWDAEIVDELQPDSQDFVIDKNRYSAFYGTGLDPILTSIGAESVVVCGVTTNMCVETTARDAMQRDYRTFVVRDATGELDAQRHEFALATLGFGFGRIVTVDEIGTAWTGQPVEVP